MEIEENELKKLKSVAVWEELSRLEAELKQAYKDQADEIARELHYVAIKELYEKRLPLYRQFADIEVDGNGTVEEVANRIVKEILLYENSCN